MKDSQLLINPGASQENHGHAAWDLPVKRLALVAMNTTLVLIVACAHCSEPSGTFADASGDRDISVPTDANRRDTSWWDGAQISDWPGWRRYTEVDPNCVLDIAIDPKAVVPPWKFVPCEIPQVGCQQLDGINWQTDGITPAISGVNITGAGKYFALARRITQFLMEQDYWDIGTGEPIFATRLDLHSTCDAGVYFGATKVTVISTIYHDPLTTLTSTGPNSVLPPSAPFVPLLPRPETQTRIIETLGASDTTLLFDLQTVGLVGRGTPGASNYILTSVGARLIAAQVHGDDIIAEEEKGPDGYARFDRVNPDGTITLLRAKPQTRVSAVAMDDGNIAWVEAWGGSPSTPQLAPHIAVWSAPYTVDPNLLTTTAKKAADWDGVTQLIPTSTNVIVSNGIYGFLAEDGINLTRLSDGKTKIVPRLSNVAYGYPVYATDTDVWAIAIEQVLPNRRLFERISFGGF